MSNERQTKITGTKSNKGKKTLAVVGLCVVVCKLPFIMALIGIGGLGFTTSLLNFSPVVKNVGMVVGVLGAMALISFWAYRTYRRSCT